MDPTLQELYSLSRSTTQQRPLTQILSSSHNPLASQPARDRPASADADAWSRYQPMSVPSIAQITIQPTFQGPFQDSLSPRLNATHRRHRTSRSHPRLYGESPQRAASPGSRTTETNSSSQYYRPGSQGREASSPPQSPQSTPHFVYNSSAEHYQPVEQLDELEDHSTYPHFARRGSDDDTCSSYADAAHGYEDQGLDDSSSLLPPQTPTPLPKIPLFVLSVVIFSEPLTSTILFPFVYFMNRYNTPFSSRINTQVFHNHNPSDFHITENEDEIGFFFASRSMCGLLNGNVGVAKSMLGEIADPSNQSQAFGLFGFAWGIGMIVGPVLGGYLANPAKTFPDTFGDWEFFIEYPYFLPCFIASMGSVIGFIVGYFFLEETKGKRATEGNPTYLEEENYDAPSDPQGIHAMAQDRTAESTAQDLDDAVSLKPRGPQSSLDIDLERQPLILPPNALAAQQSNSRSKQEMSQATQYGSMATLAPDSGANSSPAPLRLQYNSASARSTLSLRPVSARPSIYYQPSIDSGSGNAGINTSFADRPLSSGRRASVYTLSRPLSSGGPFCTTDPASLARPTAENIPADATSLSMYGYMTDSHDRASLDAGRQSQLSFAPSQVFVLPQNPNNKDPNQPIRLLVIQPEAGLSPLSITTIVAYAMLALHSIVFEEVYTLYAVTPLSSHGLGWDAILLSTSLASMGLVQLFLQFVVYPKMERRFSAVLLFRVAQLMYACVYLAFPLIRAFAVDEDDMEMGGRIKRVRYLVMVGLVFKYVCSVFSYTSVMVMITNSSPPHLLGTVNGIGQTSASFMRAFGPALGGILWAWSLSNKLSFPFNYFFVFFLMGTIAILCFIHSLSIPRELGVKGDKGK
ncbi:hypothetical protein BGZ67_003516 [Mortierella alpina]|nr:hypothetical protein BGZ67_003516 [Mortierella alpina]